MQSKKSEYVRISVTPKQAEAIRKACEFYARVINGQFSEIAWECGFNVSPSAHGTDEYDKAMDFIKRELRYSLSLAPIAVHIGEWVKMIVPISFGIFIPYCVTLCGSMTTLTTLIQITMLLHILLCNGVVNRSVKHSTSWVSPERGNMDSNNLICHYCYSNCDNLPLNAESTMYSGIEMKIICRGRALRARHYGDKDIADHQDIVNINFCPMCGRNLLDREE